MEGTLVDVVSVCMFDEGLAQCFGGVSAGTYRGNTYRYLTQNVQLQLLSVSSPRCR